MSAIINLEKIYLSYGQHPLLDQVHFQIHSGERVCLIGRNGAGKSSLLKVIDGTIASDSGKVHQSSGLSMVRLEQTLPQEKELTIEKVIAQAFEHSTNEAWQIEKLTQDILVRLELIGSQKMTDLSGGWQRRVMLAKALVTQPDLLLLDEPTNHLDIEAIQWLEDQLIQFQGGILFITHDRSLLRRLATRIIELDRGNLTSWPGDYDNFLRRKEEMLTAEAHKNREFDKKLAEEERWIRQGIKARRTRNEGRVRALKALREQRQQRRDVLGKVSFEMNDTYQSGQLVIELDQITHRYGDKTIINNFSTRIMRGDRIGILGPNGVGKTTLINILLGNMLPEQGKLKLGTKLDIAYFDQSRATLDLEKSILDNVAGGRSSIMINAKEKHIISYLADFLFPTDQLRIPVKTLSGGECNRVLLAKLFSQPANVLVMDEPTNDLDIETLELLEELLSQFSGTLLLVSHDRAFLDNIVTRTFVFEGQGKVGEYVGGYQDWVEQAPQKVTQKLLNSKKENNVNQSTIKNKKELASLPAKVEKLEKQQQELFTQIAEPGFYEQSTNKINTITENLKKIEKQIEQVYAKWEELERTL